MTARHILAFAFVLATSMILMGELAESVAVEEEVAMIHGMVDPKVRPADEQQALIKEGGKAAKTEMKRATKVGSLKSQKAELGPSELGEDSGFPGPFAPAKVDSIGTNGYVASMNFYNDLDNPDGYGAVACGGDSDDGKAQSYAEATEEEPATDLISCRDKCNACADCNGWIDMHWEHKCYFVSKFDYWEIKMGMTHVSGAAKWVHFKKYWNKVKTYEACPPGTWSVDDAPYNPERVARAAISSADLRATTWRSPRSEQCIPCNVGYYQLKETMNEHCQACAPGKIANHKPEGEVGAGVDVCKDCPAGFYSNPKEPADIFEKYRQEGAPYPSTDDTHTAGMTCIGCYTGTFARYSLEGATECKKCGIGKFGDKNELTDDADTDTGCRKCAAGKHSDTTGLTICRDCPTGWWNSYPGDTEKTFPVLKDCQQCIQGKYAPATKMTVCTNCPDGWSSFNSEGQIVIGQRKCTECPSGKYAHADWANKHHPTNIHKCEICDRGKYSPKGAKDCTVCEVGRYTADEETKDRCKDCQLGRMQDETEKLMCKACGRGKHQDQKEQTVCKDCPVGKWMPSSDKSICLDCPTGKWMDEKGAGREASPNLPNCKVCAVGRHQDEKGKTDCKDCPKGTKMASEDAAHCQECGTGWYQDETKTTVCKQCQKGKYMKFEGTSVCQNCEIGKYTDGTGRNDCTICANGRYANVEGGSGVNTGADRCSGCAKGKHAKSPHPDRGLTVCSDCTKGRYSGHSQPLCTKCHKGWYQDAIGKETCVKCDPGKHADVRELTVCKLCLDGHYSTEGFGKCVLCPPGHFSNRGNDNTKTNQCALCGLGKYETKGARPVSICKKCEKGKYVNIMGAVECEDCTTGKHMEDWNHDQGTKCKDCLAGKFAAQYGTQVCTNCQTGRYTHQNAESGCAACPQLYFQEEKGKTKCLRCPVGWASDHASPTLPGSPGCKKCAPGKTTPAGAAEHPGMEFLGEADAFLDLLCQSCAKGKYVGDEGGHCKDCEAGKYSEGEEGGSSCNNCGEGHYTDLNPANGNQAKAPSIACKACPPGWYGEKRNFPNTYGRGFHNSCRRCPSGWYQGSGGTKHCNQCPDGQTSTGGGDLNTGCINCVAGKFITLNKYKHGHGTGHGHCDNCPNGWHQVSAGKGTCVQCDKGKYVSNKKHHCAACPAGKYTHSNKATVHGQHNRCLTCSSGYYSGAGYHHAHHCQRCPYFQVSGNHHTINSHNARMKYNCQYCPRGKYVPGNQDHCASCPAGQYNNKHPSNHANPPAQNNMRGCYSCPTARWSSSAWDTCHGCGQGHYMPHNTKNHNTCRTCPRGYYSNDNPNPRYGGNYGNGESAHGGGCHRCANYHSNGGNSGTHSHNHCARCNGGYYTRWAGDVCHKTGKGWYASNGYRQYCPEGQYQNHDGQNHCKGCPGGKVHGGSYSLDSNGYCKSCPGGKVASGTKACVPKPVVNAKFSRSTGSTYQPNTGWSGSPSRAIDGNYAGGYGSNTCTHSGSTSKPYWRWNFGKTMQIEKVKVWNRQGCCEGRITGWEVKVGTNKCGKLKHMHVNEVKCNQKTGNYVQIGGNRDDWLTLCEVEVYGGPA